MIIVWEWYAWDHLIQDYNASKENYGVVGDHPELIDINYGISSSLSDWLHANSIDYNEKFDQILISVHNFNEIWVIDHSTTLEEAAGHTGGRVGTEEISSTVGGIPLRTEQELQMIKNFSVNMTHRGLKLGVRAKETSLFLIMDGIVRPANTLLLMKLPLL